MSKEEFVRKTIGYKQHLKNKWLREEINKGYEADCVAIANSIRIGKRLHTGR